MKKQTSVEYFNEEILVHLNFDQRLYLKDIFEKSKLLFEQQIINAYNEGVYLAMTPSKTAEDYYQENFKSE
jgi:hypothetical protein